MTTWADIAFAANTNITEYEPWPVEGQIVAIEDADLDWQLYEVKRVRLDTKNMLKYAECNHLFYELSDGPIRSYVLTNATPATSLAAAVVGTRWEVGTIDASLTALTKNFDEGYRNPLEFIRIIERDYSSRLSFRAVVSDHEVTNLYIDLKEIDTEFAGQRFELGHNLRSIEIIVDRESIKTALVGLGIGDEIDTETGEPKPFTFESINNGQDWVGNENARLLYGIPDGAGGMDHRFGVYRSESQTPATLKTATETQVTRQSSPKVTVEADVGDLENVKIVDIATGFLVTLDHEKIRINNITQVIARSKGLLAAVEVKVSRIERYLKDEPRTRASFGDPLALGSDYLKALEDEMLWRENRRRQLDRGRGGQTVTVASEDTSRLPWYADIIVPAGAEDAEVYFQQAVDLLPAAGGQIIILEGEYTVNDNTLVPDKITIKGQGQGTVIKIKAGKSSTIRIFRNEDLVSGNTGISIENLFLDGNKNNHSAGYINHSGLYFGNCEEISVTKVFATMFKESGIYFAGSCSNIQITDAVSFENDRRGLGFVTSTGTFERVTVSGGIYKDNGFSGIQVTSDVSVNDANVIGAVCYNNTGSGISAENINDSAFSGNSCNNNGINGMTLTDIKNSAVTGNSAIQNTFTGIAITGSLGSGAGNNSTTGNAASDNSENGISVNGTTEDSIQANKCHNNSEYGIKIVSSSANATLVTNNDLVGNTLGGLLDNGTGTITTAGNRV